MAREKNGKILPPDLADTTQLLKGVELAGPKYALEDILQEFGEKEHTAAPEEGSAKETVGEAEAAETSAAEPTDDTASEERVSDLIAGTVDAVRRENSNEAKKDEQTGPSFSERIAEASKNRKERQKRRKAAAEEEFFAEEELGVEEPKPFDCFKITKGEYTLLRRCLRLSLLPSFAAVVLIALIHFTLISEEIFALTSAVLAALALLIAFPVLKKAVRNLSWHIIGAPLLTLLASLIGIADAALVSFGSSTAHVPLAALSAPAMSFAILGELLNARARRDNFRLISGNAAAYSLISGDGRVLKQKGMAEGFVRRSYAPDEPASWQTALLPLIAAAVLVFSLLATVARGKSEDFLFTFSALLFVAALFPMPLTMPLPYARLSRRLCRNGVALAGYHGAELISHSRRMVLTDRDIFPAGTVHLNGIKVYGEDIEKVISYAATMARRSGSGIAHVFDDLLQSQGGSVQSVADFAFSEYGGYSGVIHGETVVLGVERYLRHLQVSLPKDIHVSCLLFLAVDGELIAAFPMKYPVIGTVDWAIHNLRRNHIVPVLASRDPNLTPALLKERFHTDARAIFPKLPERLKLSDENQLLAGSMGACLYREGLMPYAEAVIASRRFITACKRLTLLNLGGSAVGTLMGFYLAFSGATSMLTPLLILLYQLLFSAAAALIGINADKY